MVNFIHFVTVSLIPNKLMREWQLLFTSGLPLFEHVEQEIQELSPEKVLEEERQQMLDEGDFLEYKVIVCSFGLCVFIWSLFVHFFTVSFYMVYTKHGCFTEV